jgi:glutamate synthase domain-containing protein 2
MVVVLLLVVLATQDLVQRRHAVRRNFPVIGRLRYVLEGIGPELRQYIVTDNDEERPFSRDQRRWVYASAKRENNYFGFGSDNKLEPPPAGYLFIKHATFPHPPIAADNEDLHPVPAAKVLGGPHRRAKAFRPASIVNVSGMSYGALSGAAIKALNAGAKLAGAWQSTGEGSISPHHLQGGDLMLQIGTGYFGVRDDQGRFDLARLVDKCQAHPVVAIEVKLSQGAKPGLGALLPAAKVTPEIAAIRGIPLGKDCPSPPHHTAFSDVDGLIEFVERLADATGLPVGIKSAVGEQAFWDQLANRMTAGGGGPDFVVIDGGEGGTGAGPLVFTDHVSLPFRVGFPRVYRSFAEAGIAEQVFFVGSGKLGLPDTAVYGLALGCDAINVGREAMLAIGCIQAQRCHSGHCPTGVATQNRWLVRGLDPASKAVRCADYLCTLRKELLQIAHACGHAHPAEITLDQLEVVTAQGDTRVATELAGYKPGWGLADPADLDATREMVVNPPRRGGTGHG